MGFYGIQRELQKSMDEHTASKVFIEALENVESTIKANGEDFPVSVASFLNGYCAHLALFINNQFGYGIRKLYINGEFTHIYCQYKKNGTDLYIDCRGITDDWEEFISIWKSFGVCSSESVSPDSIRHDKEIMLTEDEISNTMCKWYMDSFGSNLDDFKYDTEGGI